MRKFEGLILVALVAALCACAYGAALTDDRDTPMKAGEVVGVTVASNETIYAGSLVAVWTNGYAYSAADTAGYKVLGRAEEYKSNSGDDYSATMTIEVRRGVFRFENGNSISDADIGDYAFVEDDQTVTTADDATNDIIAGLIVDVDDDGVWIDTRYNGGQGAAGCDGRHDAGRGGGRHEP